MESTKIIILAVALFTALVLMLALEKYAIYLKAQRVIKNREITNNNIKRYANYERRKPNDDKLKKTSDELDQMKRDRMIWIIKSKLWSDTVTKKKITDRIDMPISWLDDIDRTQAKNALDTMRDKTGNISKQSQDTLRFVYFLLECDRYILR